MKKLHLEDVNLDLFRRSSDAIPFNTPYSNTILKDLMIHPSGINVDPVFKFTFNFCHICCNFLRRNRLPVLALANDTFLGDVPSELQDLTYVEEVMIGLCRAKCSIFQLRESKHEGKSAISQTAFRGHIIIYPQDPSSTASFLPPLIEDVTSIVCIVFIGSSKPMLKWFHEKAKPLAVRADKVRNALVWLKRNNRLYRNISLNEEVLRSLPLDGILPFHIESLVSTYDNLRRSNANDSCSDHIPFDKIVITDIEGHLSSNVLRAAALKHVQKKEGAFIVVPHGGQPESEFTNPCLFPKLYPSLFPYGVGGFEDESRKYSIPFKNHVKHVLKLNDRRFQQHYSFPFIAFNILQLYCIHIYK